MADKLKILLLEDNEEDVELVERELRKEGFSFVLECADTADRFLTSLKGFKPDIILADYSLPSYDGLTALYASRENRPGCPFIFVSGTIGEEMAIETLMHGATDYVLKNRISRLVPAIRRALAEKKDQFKRIQAEKEVKASARYWEMTFNAIDDAICLINTKGKVLRANKSMAAFLGKPLSEIIGGTCWELMHGTTGPITDCPAMCMKDTRKRESMVMKAKDKIYTVTVDPVFDEDKNIPFYVHNISDITEIENAKQKIQENENRFRDLYENAPIAYFSIRISDQSIIMCNTSASGLLGFDRKNLLDRTFFDLFSQRPDGRPRAQRFFTEVMSGKTVHDRELKMQHQDNTDVWVSLTVQPVKDEAGKVIEARCVAADITRRKQLESQLRQAEKLESIGTLAGGIAHDFNNILTSILGFAQIARFNVEKNSEIEDDLKEIYNAGERAKMLVAQILSFARKSEEKIFPIRIDYTVQGVQHEKVVNFS